MPQNKPMKMQWITVNGRQVPIVLPQTYSYKDDDWKITSDQDPLPIVEYGTTEGGVIVPKRVSDDGYELTKLTGSLIDYGYHESVNIPSGSTFLLLPVVENFNIREISVSIRWETAARYDIIIEYYHRMGITSIVGTEKVEVRDDIMKPASFVLQSPYFRIIVRNVAEQENQIMQAIVTGRR